MEKWPDFLLPQVPGWIIVNLSGPLPRRLIFSLGSAFLGWLHIPSSPCCLLAPNSLHVLNYVYQHITTKGAMLIFLYYYIAIALFFWLKLLASKRVQVLHWTSPPQRTVPDGMFIFRVLPKRVGLKFALVYFLEYTMGGYLVLKCLLLYSCPIFHCMPLHCKLQ